MPKKFLWMLQEFEAVHRILQMHRYVTFYFPFYWWDYKLTCLTLDCQNVNDKTAPLLDAVKSESEQLYSEPMVEESYIIENEIPISCYTMAPKKKRLNILTRDIIESTIECVLSQAEECRKNNVTATIAEHMVIEEFGRCLDEILRLTNMQSILGWFSVSTIFMLTRMVISNRLLFVFMRQNVIKILIWLCRDLNCCLKQC